MLKTIKRIISKRITPRLEKIYWKLSNNSPAVDLSAEQELEIDKINAIASFNRYGSYCVPRSSNDRPAAQMVLKNEVYEPDTISFMMKSCGNGDIVHAGTYFGDFLPALSKGLGSKSKIFAFEPNMENYHCARMTVNINKLTNVELRNAGLGAQSDNLLVLTADEAGHPLGGASRIVREAPSDQVTTSAVDIIAIDDVIGSVRDVSIIQLDVEGYEQEALIGALNHSEMSPYHYS